MPHIFQKMTKLIVFHSPISLTIFYLPPPSRPERPHQAPPSSGPLAVATLPSGSPECPIAAHFICLLANSQPIGEEKTADVTMIVCY